MVGKDWSSDRRLDIVVLGAMTAKSGKNSHCAAIKQALEKILNTETGQQQLTAAGVSSENKKIHIPQDWHDAEIINGVFARLDIADLVVVDLTPKSGINGEASPNVFYELGIVHSLGLPYILIARKGMQIPFYFKAIRTIRVPRFAVNTLVSALHNPIIKFLDQDDRTNFSDNHITQFYQGLPVLDISAAVGLATGYFDNFVSRILRRGGFITTYPKQLKALIVIRPENIFNQYDEDKESLRNTLEQAELTLKEGAKFDKPVIDDRGPAWVDVVNKVIIDLPRTVYSLKNSPRLLAMQDRMRRDMAGQSNAEDEFRLQQTSKYLLDRIEQVLRYHVGRHPDEYRISGLHFSSIRDLPSLISKINA